MKIISGIQQIGIGVKNVEEAWKWYRQNFGMDIKVLDDATVAELMLPYTGNKPQERHAALALNLQGGGGFEIWQYTKRTPQAPKFDIQIGDLGIFAAKIKSNNVDKAYEKFKQKGLNLLGKIHHDKAGNPFFYVKDPFGNIFQIVHSPVIFRNENKLTGGPSGAIIGVSNIEKALKVYSDILGYNSVIYEENGLFDDFEELPGGKNHKFKRVLLKSSNKLQGSFSKLFGQSTIELIEVKDRTPEKIYKDRFWGDLGFIHLCYDISGMDDLQKECTEKGFPFTVDSNINPEGNKSFDMGEAAGRFTYIEDPDGTLIEFVETHKLPIIKKIGWFLDLRKRDPKKQLPKRIINALRFSRIKD
jgi:catechol 2,3-dioxygenase-like lactoylglutathione lyase family enzyme